MHRRGRKRKLTGKRYLLRSDGDGFGKDGPCDDLVARWCREAAGVASQVLDI